MRTKEVEWDGLPTRNDTGRFLPLPWELRFPCWTGHDCQRGVTVYCGGFAATPSMSIWIVNAYQLAIVVSLLSLSSLGDILGYRRVYIGGLLIFSVTSLACALSNSLLTLTIARVFQGFGAAALASVNTSLIRIIIPNDIWGGEGPQCASGCRVGGRGADDCGQEFCLSPLGSGCSR